MRELELLRFWTGDLGTLGQLWHEGECKLRTIELPWVSNKLRISCIPAGRYLVGLDNTRTKGICYRVLNVPDRTDILIHVANWGGDRRKPHLKSDLLGCIGFGDAHRELDGQLGVSDSKRTLAWFRTWMSDEPFYLTIRWANSLQATETETET